MPTENEYIKIKKRYFIILFFALFFFVAGYIINSWTTGRFVSVSSESVENCKTFCELASVEYAYVKDNHCFCDQKQVVYDRVKNETITITQTMDSGVIKDIKIESGLTPEAQRIIQQQQQRS